MKHAFRVCALLAIVLADGGRNGQAAPQTVRELYTTAVLREQALRAAPVKARSSVKDYRATVSAYDAVVRRFPTSGYVDNALWQGAIVAGDAFERFGDERDRSTARRMLELLVDQYPSSPLVRKARDVLERMHGPKTVADVERPAPSSTPAPRPARRKAVVLREIRRTSMRDRVRVTIELDEPTTYRTERVENPHRVNLDLSNTRPGHLVPEGTLFYHDDIVRRVRVGIHPNQVTRVVVDLDGVARYTVSTLERPYRIVVDCERTVPVPLPKPASPTPSPAAAPAGPPVRPPAAPPAATTAPETVAAPPGNAPTLPEVAAPSMRPGPTSAKSSPPASARATRATRAPVDPEWLPQPLPSHALVLPSARLIAPVADALPSSFFAHATEQPSPPAFTLPAPTPPASTALARTAAPKKPAPIFADQTAPPPVAERDSYSLARQLGLGASKIVIDPGHGGHDPGAIGPGISEAEVVLDVALRLEALLRDAGFGVVLTRRTDEFIPLEERPAIATREQADLFLSIHANASRNQNARGIESYFLNFATDLDAAAVAARENAATGRTMNNLPEIVRAITLNSKLDESRSFASLIQRAMAARLSGANKGLRDHGVKQAPFVVLIGASMPSVLAEISFITNAQEARLLKSGAYRQRIAQALFDAVRGYQRSLKNAQVVLHQ